MWTIFIHPSQQVKRETFSCPISQMMQLSHREVVLGLAQGHIASEWWSRIQTRVCLAPEPALWTDTSQVPTVSLDSALPDFSFLSIKADSPLSCTSDSALT